jgi:3-hydroxyisobutyrate dehydrogenase
MTAASTAKPTVALLGVGIMGAGMARNILKAGLPLRVWNRSRAKAEPLAAEGAQVFDSPAEAVEGADVILTMLRDRPTVAQVIEDAAAGLREGQVWAQTTTVGPTGAAQLAQVAGKHGLVIVDAPVLGTRAPAEQGELVLFAAGPRSAEQALRPVFEAVGRKTVWLGEDAAEAAASKLKLVVNSWVLAVTGAGAEAVALAKALDVDPQGFLDAVEGGPLDLPYLRVKAGAILRDDWEEPGFTVNVASKDADLIAEAGRENGARLYLAEAMATRLHLADEQGHGDKDMAANYFASFD